MDNNVIEKIKEMVRKGNVSRILVRKEDKILVDVPVSVGILGGVAALAASKLLVIAGAVAAVGYGCTIEVIKDDGQVVDVLTEEKAEKARSVAQGVVEDIKSGLHINTEKAEEADFEETVSADEPAEEDTPEE
ncbi:MAG: DUF4342 domain-containing protein [Oscillospiraceae bacterium]|nr:DUF4342 domain-containing protein [Oscillospiraceae bacterium]